MAIAKALTTNTSTLDATIASVGDPEEVGTEPSPDQQEAREVPETEPFPDQQDARDEPETEPSPDQQDARDEPETEPSLTLPKPATEPTTIQRTLSSSSTSSSGSSSSSSSSASSSSASSNAAKKRSGTDSDSADSDSGHESPPTKKKTSQHVSLPPAVLGAGTSSGTSQAPSTPTSRAWPPSAGVTRLEIELPYGWRKEGVRRGPGGAKPNQWDFALLPPSNYVKKLRRPAHLEEFRAKNPDVQIDSSVTNFNVPTRGRFTVVMDPVPKLIIPKLITPKLVAGTPDVGAVTPVRPYSPPVKLSSRSLCQAVTRDDSADGWVEH